VPKVLFPGKQKFRWHHADHNVWLAVEPQTLPDHSGISSETTLPQSVAQDNRSLSTGPMFFRREGSTNQRINAQGLEEPGRDEP
jgi:hypothetical protein